MGLKFCVGVSLMVVASSFAQLLTDSARKHYKTALCLTHLEPTEVYLSCSSHGLINLISVQYGFQEIALDDRVTCSYMESGACLHPLSELGRIRKHCMGVRECRFSVSVVYLEQCERDSDFVQAEYECIPGNSADFGNVVDICGDVLTGDTITRSEGYIESLNYPANYPRNLMCTCNLTAKTGQSEIVLQVLDEDLQPSVYNNKGDDWLEFTTNLEQWANGKAVIVYESMEEVRTDSSHVFLNFRSDAKNEGRGFWLRYKAETADGGLSPIDISCQKFIPQDYRSNIVCFNGKTTSQERTLTNQQQKQELFLSCSFYGVINILYAEHGYDANLDDLCTPTRARTCTLNAAHEYDVMSTCMGQRECRVTVDQRTIPSCSVDANYFQIEYQCIADHNSQDNNIDICGDKTGARTVVNQVGHIESLNYPHQYLAGSDCQCHLEADDNEAEIILTVLDMELDQGENGAQTCETDWLEYVRHTQDIGSGTRICNQPIREPIHTDAREIYLNFHTDQRGEARGFWVKYYARREDGSKTAVQVTCSGSTPLVVMETPANPPSSSGSNPGSNSVPYGKPPSHSGSIQGSNSVPYGKPPSHSGSIQGSNSMFFPPTHEQQNPPSVIYHHINTNNDDFHNPGTQTDALDSGAGGNNVVGLNTDYVGGDKRGGGKTEWSDGRMDDSQEADDSVWSVHVDNGLPHDVYFGLIIGLAVVAIVMFVLLALLIFLKFKRSRRLKKDSPPPVPLRSSLSHSNNSGPSSDLNTRYGSTYSTGFDTAHVTMTSSQSRASLQNVNNNKHPVVMSSRRNSCGSAGIGIENPGYAGSDVGSLIALHPNSETIPNGSKNLNSAFSRNGVSGVSVIGNTYREPEPDYDVVGETKLTTNCADVKFSNRTPRNPVYDENDTGIVRKDYFYNL